METRKAISPEIQEILELCKASEAGFLSDEELILFEALNTEEGRQTLAQAMISPIRRSLDYQGVSRSLLQVEELPLGALAVYEEPHVIPIELEEPEVPMSVGNEEGRFGALEIH